LRDAGVMGSAAAIRSAADARFGRRAPEAIPRTLRSVGALETLAAEWDVPV